MVQCVYGIFHTLSRQLQQIISLSHKIYCPMHNQGVSVIRPKRNATLEER